MMINSRNFEQYQSLHITNGLGTDIVVGLPENPVWTVVGESIETSPDEFCVTGAVISRDKQLIFAEGQIVECIGEPIQNPSAITKISLSSYDEPSSSYIALGDTIITYGNRDTKITATNKDGQTESILEYGELLQ